MNAAEQVFPGGAYEGKDDSAAVVGQLTVTAFSVKFESEPFTLDLPMQGLQIALDDEGERVLVSHRSYPGWTIYSLDPAMLKHPSWQRTHLRQRITELTRQQSGSPQHAARVYKAMGGIVVILFGLWACTDLIVGAIVNVLPAEWELKIGKEAFMEVREIFPLTEAAPLTNRLYRVTQRMKKGLPNNAPKFEYYVSINPLINAIALPGGKVVVLQGLLADATPEELAGVLAHEMAHVIQKHAMRQVAQDVGPAFISKYFFGGDSALAAMIEGSSQLGQLQYSRHNERKADDMAFDILVKANIDPRGLASFFRKVHGMEAKMGMGGDVFSTHPPTVERITFLEKRWEALPKKTGFQPVDAGPPLPDEYKGLRFGF